jgi:hypothetical protein
MEANDMPKGFPLDRAERSVHFGVLRVGPEQYLLPSTDIGLDATAIVITAS